MRTAERISESNHEPAPRVSPEQGFDMLAHVFGQLAQLIFLGGPGLVAAFHLDVGRLVALFVNVDR